MSIPLTLIRRVELGRIELWLARADRGDLISGPAVIDENGKRVGQLVCIMPGAAGEIEAHEQRIADGRQEKTR